MLKDDVEKSNMSIKDVTYLPPPSFYRTAYWGIELHTSHTTTADKIESMSIYMQDLKKKLSFLSTHTTNIIEEQKALAHPSVADDDAE